MTIRNISDTALWAAVHRARETERPDALFRDPLAAKLAGERGRQIAETMKLGDRNWAWMIRTYLFDQFIAAELARGADAVLNLAAGLDTRPYRMSLPPSLRWIEVDLPEIIEYKNEVLADERPVCALERRTVDLTDLVARRALFREIGEGSKRVLVLTEGLLIYLHAPDVGTLATDLAAQPSFAAWITDLASPGLLRRLQKTFQRTLGQARAPLVFGPPEGPDFFTSYGWKATQVESMFSAAARLKRVPFPLSLFALLPEPKQPAGDRVWGGTILLLR